MGYCVLSRKEIADLFDKQKIGVAYVNYIDYPFLPIGLLVDELEKRKKKSVLPQQLIGYIKKMPAQVFHISLNSRNLVEALQDEEKYGVILRAKGIVAGESSWLHFDYVPGEGDVRKGSAAITGRLCVIGCKLNEDALKALFHV